MSAAVGITGIEVNNTEEPRKKSGENSILRVEGLRKQFRSKVAVSDVSFSMKQGDVVGLLGPNGAGKTTTFYMIAGFIKVSGGTVWLDNKNITMQPMYRRAKAGINYLPQEPSVFRKLTVAQNVMAVLEARDDLSAKERKTVLNNLLDDLGIASLADQRADTLSGGERRRTEICRSLATNPEFLLLDEPFSGIDPIAVGDLREIIKRLSVKNIGILITDHNVRDTLAITDYAYIIHHGEILTSGSPDELLKDERAREIYLGHDFSM